jgi:pimeloyl-ACP methyl ester carboxylesterase
MFGVPGNWDTCAERLAPRWRVFAPELPLFSLPAARATVDGIGEAVREWLAAAGIGRVILGGNSLGGHVALHLALGEPARVAALVLAGSSGLFERGFERVPRRPSREWLAARVREVFYDASLVTEAMVDEVAAVIGNRASARQFLRIAKSTKQQPLHGELHRIRCPSLLMWGANDQITPPAVAREFHDLLPHSELQFIDRCGHAPMIERPQKFCDLLEQFLERIKPLLQDPAPVRGQPG